jgi:hypothetical protein
MASAIGILAIAAVVVALLLRFVPFGYFDYDSLALTDANIAQNLKSEELAKGDKTLAPEQFPVSTPIFERAGAIYGGDDKIKLNSSFPVYSDDGAVLRFLGDDATLITEELERVSTYRNLYTSDGITFNEDRERADSQKFTLLSVSGGVYINLSKAEVGSYKIPMNSVLYFAEDHISIYKLMEKQFIFDRIDGLGEDSIIKIGDKTYNYYDLLRGLGLLASEKDAPPKVEKPEEPEVPIVKPDKPEKVKPVPVPAEPGEETHRVSIHLSPAQCYISQGKQVGYMNTRLSVLDRSSLVTSDVSVYLFEGDEKGKLVGSYTLPRAEFKGKGDERVFRDFRVDRLVKGREYTLFGTYDYKDDKGKQHVIFDRQTFIFERPQQVVEEPLPPGYVRPEVELVHPYTAEVYFIDGHQDVNDPAGRIRGGIQYEIYRLNESDTKVFMRKSISGTTDTHLGLLPPGEPFRIVAYYTYLNERDQMIRVDLGEELISTLPFPKNAKLKLHYASGNIFSNKIQFKNVYIDQKASDARLLEAATRIGVFAKKKGDAADIGKDYFVSSVNAKAIRDGEATVFDTTSTLKSRTTYSYEWSVYDPFGNQIPLVSPFSGQTRTSSEAPYANILVSPKAGDTGFSIRISNPDNVDISNAHIAFYEVIDGVESTKPVSTQTLLSNGYGTPRTRYNISPSGTEWTYKINIANFKLDRVYVIKVIGDYDLEDGPNNTANLRTNQIIGTKQFIATTLKSLGNVAFNTSVKSVSGHEANILENVNRYATQAITLDLLSRVTFEIYKAEDLEEYGDDAVPALTPVTISKTNPDDADAWAALLDPNIRYENILKDLQSKQEYRIKIIPEILIVDDYYTLPAVNDLDKFFTKKQVPKAVIKNGDLLAFTDAIYIFDARIDDPDGAVLDGNVSMLVVNGSLVPVYSATLEPNKNYDFQIPGLETGDTYTITFTAPAYNDAFDERDYTSYRTNVRLETLPTGEGEDENVYSEREKESSEYNDCYRVKTEDGISGRLTLRGMDVIKDGSGKIIPGSLNTKLRSEIVDTAQYLKGNPTYSLVFYRNLGYGDFKKNLEIDFPYTWTENLVDDQVIELDSKYYYRAELWIKVGGRDIMIDQVLFDTQGPMTPIFTTDQLRWLNGADARGGEDLMTKPLTGEWAATASLDVQGNKVPDGFGDGPVLTAADTGGRFGRYLVIEDLYHFYNTITDEFGLATDAGYDLVAIADVLAKAPSNQTRTPYIRGVSTVNPGSGNSASGNGPFNGIIDFQGHTLKYNVHTGSNARPGTDFRQIFYQIGYTGVLRNLTLEYGITGENPGETTNITPVYVNRGKIENIRIKSMKDNGRYNYAYSTLCYSNAISGVIENFTVDLGEGVSTRAGFGGAVYSNNGIVRNGYVYGTESGATVASDTQADANTRSEARAKSRHGRIAVPIVPGAENTGFSVTNLGGAVASNTATGRVSNVYSLADTYVNVFGTGAARTYTPQNVGSVVGQNSGRVDSIYSLGEAYYNTTSVLTYKAGINPNSTSSNYVYGPAIGSVATAARTNNSYYITADPSRTYNISWGTKTSFDTLHDYLWQQRITGKAFEALKTVTAGYFPQLVQTYGMPAQPYLPLPEVSAVENVELSSVFIEKQMEDYAIALVTLKNRAYYQISGFSIGSLDATVVPGSQIDSEGVSRVQVRLTNPSEYKSSYTINGFSYRLLNSSYTYNATANMIVSAEFFKMVRTQQDWVDINNNRTWNYRLGNDLDLTGLAPAKMQLGTYSTASTVNANDFTGAIDGGYYDDDYKLKGIYTLSGIDLGTSTSTTGVGLIPTLFGGTVSNMQIDGVKIETPNATDVGLINFTYAGAKIDNVHIKNSSFKGYSYVGTLVSRLNFTDVTNCSVNSTRLRDAVKSSGTGTYMGGFAAVVDNGSTIFNSYVYGVDIVEDYGDQNRGVGGFIGRFNSGEVSNVYAQGKVKINSIDINVGGLIGYRDSNDRILENCWVDVNVVTEGRNAGGLIGGASTMTDFAELDALVVGDVDTSLSYVADADNRPTRRIVGTTGGNDEALGIKGPIAGSFAYEGQLIATRPYDTWEIMGADGHPQGPGRDGATIATAEDLLSDEFYLGTMHMDDGFVYDGLEFADTFPEYTGVEGGYLPLLRHTEGWLLPYQTVRKPLDHNYSINVISTESDGGLNWTVVMQIAHPAGAKIKSLVIDNIEISGSDIATAYEITPQSNSPNNTSSSVVLTFKRAHILKFVDTYAITGVVVEDPNDDTKTITEPAASRILFNAQDVPYLLINDELVWCEQMTADKHGQTTENIRITGDLNFASGSVTSEQIKAAINVKVNRLVGLSSKSKIRNLNLQFDQIGMGFVNYVNALVQDISFENVDIEQTAEGGVRTGIIAQCSGTILRVDFTNLDLKLNGASYAGAIGYMSGIVDTVNMKNIHVDGTRTATQKIYTYAGNPYGGTTSDGKTVSNQGAVNGGQANYIGGLIGYAVDSTISNITLTYDAAAAVWPGSPIGSITMEGGKPLGEYDLTLAENPNIVWGRYMVGGIAGALYTTRISDCKVEYTSAYGEIYNTTNSLAGTQSTSDCYVGALAGYTTIFGNEPRNERLHSSHVRVITEGQRAGGMFGHGLSYATPEEPTTVEHAVVIAAGAYAGGFTGVWYSTSAHVEVSDVKVFSRSYAGGFTGATSSTTYASSVRDSVIGSIFDNGASSSVPSFWEPKFKGDYIYQNGANYPDVMRMQKPFELTPGNYTGYNKYYGGFSGAGRVYSVTIANTEVGAEGADYVAGGAGTSDSSHNFDTILDTKVYGRNYVGGITGYLPKNSIGYNTSNAQIVATGNYVGGIAGAFKPDQALDGANAAYERNNMISGSVQGADYVGGLVGTVVGNLYPIKDRLVYYYENPHANATATNVANNTSLATPQLEITRDRDSIMIAKVKVTGGTHGSLLYNLDESLNTAVPIEGITLPMGHRIWEYSVLDMNGTAKYAKDLMNGSEPLYKYGSKDGEYAAAYLDARNDGRGFREEPLYSTENLLITREHLLGTYSPVGINFAYTNAATAVSGVTPNIDSDTGLVTNWTTTNSFMRNDDKILGSPGSTAGTAGNATTGVGGAGGIASMRAVYRANYGTGQNEPSYWWYGGFRSGYLPYTTAQIIYYYQANSTTSPRSQAPYSEGSDASGNYYPVAHSAFVSPDEAFGVWKPFTATGRSPGSKFFYYTPGTAHTYTGAWTSKHYSDANVDQTYGGGIRIPANPDGVATFSAMSVSDEMPEATVYPVSADKISIDFSGYQGGGAFSLMDSKGTELFGGPIQKRTYTFSYDFKKKLSLVVGSNSQTKTIDVDPALLMRTISVFGEDHYHLAGGGVYAGNHADGALIEGSFVNIIGGEALTSDGEVYDITTGEVTRKFEEISLCDEAVPLYEFEFEGVGIKTFANYSVMSTGEVQPLRLYVKDGRLAAISPDMPIAKDALVLDYNEGEVGETASEIMTVLGDDGVIADIKEPIKLPDGFRADFVREMSNTLSSDKTVCLVRYKSGRVVAFDYLTGEEITLQSDKGEGSIFEYAKAMFAGNVNSMFATLSGSYDTLQDIEAEIRGGTIPGSGSDGTVTEGGTVSGSGGEATEGGAGGSGNDAAATGEKGADGGIAGVTAGAGTEESKLSGGGDLSRPEKAPSLVSVYDITTGKYKVFDASSLTTTSNVEPITAVDIEEIDAASMLESMKAFGDRPVDIGLLILFIIAAAIAGLLVYVAIKRYRLTK